MSTRPVVIALAVVATAFIAIFVTAQVDWPGSLADCVAAGTCDCEEAGTDGLRQSVNASSSLALILVGGLIIAAASGLNLKLLGVAVFVSGAASYLSHAAVRDWSHTFDSLGVKAVLVFLIVYPATRPRPVVAPYSAAVALVWGLELLWPGTGPIMFAGLLAAAVTLNLPEARRGTAMRAAMLGLVVGGAAWWLGKSGSPICDPDSLFQPHALWHLLVAGSLAAVYSHYQAAEPQ